MKRTQASYLAFQNEAILSKGERILMCYAIEDPEVGYVQGMNMILSGFLYHIEEEAYCYGVFRKLFLCIRKNYLNNFAICYQHVD